MDLCNQPEPAIKWNRVVHNAYLCDLLTYS